MSVFTRAVILIAVGFFVGLASGYRLGHHAWLRAVRERQSQAGAVVRVETAATDSYYAESQGDSGTSMPGDASSMPDEAGGEATGGEDGAPFDGDRLRILEQQFHRLIDREGRVIVVEVLDVGLDSVRIRKEDGREFQLPTNLLREESILLINDLRKYREQKSERGGISIPKRESTEAEIIEALFGDLLK